MVESIYVNEQKVRRYWTNACGTCAIKHRCTTGKERRITRWEHEHVLESAQRRLDKNPQAMRQRRETVEHPKRFYATKTRRRH
jgi:transposase